MAKIRTGRYADKRFLRSESARERSISSWSDHNQKAATTADYLCDAAGASITLTCTELLLGRCTARARFAVSDRSSPPLAGWARRLRSEEIGMSPGGHLVTTVAACAASVVLTRNLPMADTVALAGGIAAGGFLVGVGHAIDHGFVGGQIGRAACR